VTFEDRPWLRNPFGSIHAIALANLGELTSGLCLISAMQHLPLKGIPVRIDTMYLRKARGTITGECTISLKALTDAKSAAEFVVETILSDTQGAVVAKTSVTWSLREVASSKKQK
jgi:acyl-coenzyme A thioesterase PaaI-like protein